LLSGWAQQGVQSYFATQRILLDLAMRQNSSVMHVMRERLSDPNRSPAKILSEIAGEGLTNLMEAQQVLLDLAQQHNEIVMDGVKERVAGSNVGIATAELLRRGIDNLIDTHHKFLKIVEKQSHTWIENAKAGKFPKNDALIEMAREAMDNFVHAEKHFLDVVAEETSRATNGRHHGGSAKKTKKTELTDLARKATESFIEAQKKLFDVAGRQMNANLRTAGRTMDVLGPLPVLPFSDLTREGVKSFVDAQKALMEVMTKAGNGSTHTAKPHRGKKRTGTARAEAHAAHAAG
jgi:hypothetical protein